MSKKLMDFGKKLIQKTYKEREMYRWASALSKPNK